MRQQGAVLVLTLVVLTAVVAILAATAASQRQAFDSARGRIETIRARAAAEAGLQRAIAILAEQGAGTVNQTNDWFNLGTQGDENFLVGDASFRLQIKDAGGFVNLNTATEEQLGTLNLTQEQIDSLLDWREASETSRPEGAKNDYYATLPEPYKARLRRMESLDELLLVKGFDASVLYRDDREQTSSEGITPQALYRLATVDSSSPNQTPGGQQKTNINNANQQQLTQAGLSPQVAQAIILRRTGTAFTTMGEVLGVAGVNEQNAGALLDNFMTGTAASSEGLININTATEDVLSTIPGLSADIAASIVSRQSSGFASLGELLQVSGFNLALLRQTADRFTIASERYLIRIEGKAGGTIVAVEAVVSVGQTPTILKTLDPPYQNMRELWQWTDETSTETVLGDRR